MLINICPKNRLIWLQSSLIAGLPAYLRCMCCMPCSMARPCTVNVSGHTAPGIISPTLQRVMTWSTGIAVSNSLRSDPKVVIGRACSQNSSPLLSIAHSMSSSEPMVWAACLAPIASLEISSLLRMALLELSSEWVMALEGSNSKWSGVTSPLTKASPKPATASIIKRSCRPVTGSAVNKTPAARGSTILWTTTHISTSPISACSDL